VQLPEGRCVGVSVDGLADFEGSFATPASLATNPDHWMHAAYHPKELAFGMELSEAVASSFWLGRLAMRIALQFPDYPILKDSYGRPQLGGSNMCGSISHKGMCGISLVSNSTVTKGVGVDLEFTARPGKRSIAPRVLTQREQESLGSIPGVSVEEEILLRFRYVMIWR
jgi:4'-phosphopantetheinyl transferase EntD